MSREKPEAISQTEFLLLLHSAPHIGEKALARLLRLTAQQRLMPEDCLSLTSQEWQEKYELHPLAAEALALRQDTLRAQAAALHLTLRKYQIQPLTLESGSYPQRLDRNDDAPPPLLYALGNQNLLSHSYTAERFTFTIAVSNGASAESLSRLDTLAKELIEQGGVPVTGHDRMPYQRLALTAQRQNLPTVYVFDRGLREVLGADFDKPPFSAARIRDLVFDTSRDLALSPFRLDDHSLGDHNKRRDRIVCALSDIIIALDVREGGGMADECLRAMKQRQPVFVAVGGREGNSALRDAGCLPIPTGKKWVQEVLKCSK